VHERHTVFNCQLCKETVGPKISPVRVVTEARPAEYHNEFYREDEWGNREKHEVDSQGREIVHEVIVCPTCAKEEPIKASTQVVGGRTFREKDAPPLRVKFIASVIDGMLRRLNDKGKRAKQDTEFVVPNIKSFVDANKELVF
jgi:hypothetical protein